jgi:hypothetical protein
MILGNFWIHTSKDIASLHRILKSSAVIITMIIIIIILDGDVSAYCL